jgi:hypothetical protein
MARLRDPSRAETLPFNDGKSELVPAQKKSAAILRLRPTLLLKAFLLKEGRFALWRRDSALDYFGVVLPDESGDVLEVPLVLESGGGVVVVSPEAGGVVDESGEAGMLD